MRATLDGLENVTTAIHADRFYHDGRGPTLERAHWRNQGRDLAAIDYRNHDDRVDRLKHVLFMGIQVVKITPEEVINYDRGWSERVAATRPAAMWNLGQSAWLKSFAPRHLSKCHHFQLMFYDELFDIVAEEVACRDGGFRTETAV